MPIKILQNKYGGSHLAINPLRNLEVIKSRACADCPCVTYIIKREIDIRHVRRSDKRHIFDMYGGWFVPFRCFFFFVFFCFVFFCLFAWRYRYGAVSRRNNAKRKDEITKKNATKRRNNIRQEGEITKCATRNDEKRARKDEKTPCKITQF